MLVGARNSRRKTPVLFKIAFLLFRVPDAVRRATVVAVEKFRVKSKADEGSPRSIFVACDYHTPTL
jgi:hypothetical protein